MNRTMEKPPLPPGQAILRSFRGLHNRVGKVKNKRKSQENVVRLKRSLSLRSMKNLVVSPLGEIRENMQRRVCTAIQEKRMKGGQDFTLSRNATGAMGMLFKKESCMDSDLQQKIEREIKMRDGIAKLLAAAKHPHQLMEAAKNMLVSNTRVLTYMTELQRRKSEEVRRRHDSTPLAQSPCSAKVSISDLRLPLMWKDSDHFKNKGDHRRYAVFCLLKIGADVHDTTLLKDVDRSKTDICFEDIILFSNVPYDFTCTLEVYSHQLHQDVSMASTPKKIQKKINEISSSMGRSVGRRLSGLMQVQSTDASVYCTVRPHSIVPPFYIICVRKFNSSRPRLPQKEEEIMNSLLVGPRFDRIAHATLRLRDVQDHVGTYDLVLDNPALLSLSEAARADATSSTDLPLFENFCCQISAQPNSLVFNVVQTILDVESSGGESRCYSCTLKNRQISGWLSQSDTDQCDPDLAIPINKYTAIETSPDDRTDNQRSIQVTYQSSHGGKFTHTLKAQSDEDHNRWWEGLQQHLLDQVMWQHAFDKLMEVKTPRMSMCRTASVKSRKTSLYDEIAGGLENDMDSFSIGSSGSRGSIDSSPSWRDKRVSTRLASSSSRSEVSS